MANPEASSQSRTRDLAERPMPNSLLRYRMQQSRSSDPTIALGQFQYFPIIANVAIVAVTVTPTMTCSRYSRMRRIPAVYHPDWLFFSPWVCQRYNSG